MKPPFCSFRFLRSHQVTNLLSQRIQFRSPYTTAAFSSIQTIPLAYNHSQPHHPQNTKPPIIILHGLFGSKQNWKALSKSFAARLNRDVYALDLRNHGDSPHVEQHTYPAMAMDVLKFMEERIEKEVGCIVMGHSMGGKVAMTLSLYTSTLSQPTIPIRQLIVVDIPPIEAGLSSDFAHYVEAMRTVESVRPEKQSTADQILLEYEIETSVRQFLLTNLKRNPDTGIYAFRVPIETLAHALPDMGSFPFQPSENITYTGPTILINGSKSPYIKKEYEKVTKEFFPKCEFVTVEAGHWVHAEKPDEFVKIVTKFVEKHDTNTTLA